MLTLFEIQGYNTMFYATDWLLLVMLLLSYSNIFCDTYALVTIVIIKFGLKNSLEIPFTHYLYFDIV